MVIISVTNDSFSCFGVTGDKLMINIVDHNMNEIFNYNKPVK